MLFVTLRLCVVMCGRFDMPLCSCQSDTNGSILYDHAKYVILLTKVKKKCQIVVVTYTISTFLQFLIVLKRIFFCTNKCGMIP